MERSERDHRGYTLRYITTCSVRASKDRPAYREQECHTTVEVRVDEETLALAVERLGWRMYRTHQPVEQLSLAQALLAYRSAYLVERSLGRLNKYGL
jgi:hypothetical protein